MRKIKLGKTGESIPVLGQGTWGIKTGRNKNYYIKWKDSLRRGIELGMTHIDTAEFYGFGTSERVIGELIKEFDRDDLFITSKIFPIHFGYKAMLKACKKSLKRLDIKYIDLYLVHFPSFLFSKIKKHMRVMEQLFSEGKIRYIGVSNYSVEKFKIAQDYLKKTELITNQLHTNIMNQKHIHKSLPYYQKEGVTLTAYSPLSHRGYTNLKGDFRLKLDKLAETHNASIQQIAIAWLINHENVIAIPKAFQLEHIEENAASAEIELSDIEIKSLYR
ncbi:MAG: aldo/keto reductase [Promethearchaeota archaeon]|nr:MAG: aldo/keto reductase [Candidatus Lokiarchaeota archaeon]